MAELKFTGMVGVGVMDKMKNKVRFSLLELGLGLS